MIEYKGKKLNVAVCISGQLRKLNQTQVPKTFRDLSPDYYIHTWDNEYNPHLAKASLYFPDAVIEAESYEAVFDKILETDGFERTISSNRYDYAQFYTITKSFNMCLASDKQYDLVIRCRTDNDLSVKQYWHPEVVSMLSDLDSYVSNHYRHFLSYSNVDVPMTSSFITSLNSFEEQINPMIAIKIKTLCNNLMNIDDWFWITNSKGLEFFGNLDPIDMVKTAQQIRQDHNNRVKDVTGSYLEKHEAQLKSPLVWSQIFNDNSVHLMNHYSAFAGIIRKQNSTIIPGHGDIS